MNEEHDAVETGPAYTDRYHCPVQACAWHHDVPLGRLTTAIGQQMDTMQTRAGQLAEIDRAVVAHLATHPVVDFVRTIAGLRARLRAIEYAAQVVDADQALPTATSTTLGELRRALGRDVQTDEHGRTWCQMPGHTIPPVNLPGALPLAVPHWGCPSCVAAGRVRRAEDRAAWEVGS